MRLLTLGIARLLDWLPHALAHIREPVRHLASLEARQLAELALRIVLQIGILCVLNEPFLQDSGLTTRKVVFLDALARHLCLHRLAVMLMRLVELFALVVTATIILRWIVIQRIIVMLGGNVTCLIQQLERLFG